MQEIIFATTNVDKLKNAAQALQQYGWRIVQQPIEVDEIQSEDPRRVAIDKAAKAFKVTGKPTIVSDDSWSFAGLGGFPGVYMHSINSWFTPQDFLHITLPLKNRKVTLTQYVVYQDSTIQKVFTRQTHGVLLAELKGTSKHPSHTIISLDGDNGLSIAEALTKRDNLASRESAKVWHELAEWLTQNA